MNISLSNIASSQKSLGVISPCSFSIPCSVSSDRMNHYRMRSPRLFPAFIWKSYTDIPLIIESCLWMEVGKITTVPNS